jgi:hypothetical protein
MQDKDKEERKLKKVKIGLMREPRFALWANDDRQDQHRRQRADCCNQWA